MQSCSPRHAGSACACTSVHVSYCITSAMARFTDSLMGRSAKRVDVMCASVVDVVLLLNLVLLLRGSAWLLPIPPPGPRCGRLIVVVAGPPCCCCCWSCGWPPSCFFERLRLRPPLLRRLRSPPPPPPPPFSISVLEDDERCCKETFERRRRCFCASPPCPRAACFALCANAATDDLKCCALVDSAALKYMHPRPLSAASLSAGVPPLARTPQKQKKERPQKRQLDFKCVWNAMGRQAGRESSRERGERGERGRGRGMKKASSDVQSSATLA